MAAQGITRVTPQQRSLHRFPLPSYPDSCHHPDIACDLPFADGQTGDVGAALAELSLRQIERLLELNFRLRAHGNIGIVALEARVGVLEFKSRAHLLSVCSS